MWSCPLHEDWAFEEWRDLVGRVADLKSAYKQLPRHPRHANVSIIAVKNPKTQRVEFFETLSMMFGQTAAVYAFLRFSRAISAIAAVTMSLLVVEFFDDFTQIEPASTAQSGHRAFEQVIELLGWRLSKSEKKRKDYAKVFVSLGVLIDFTASSGGWIVLKCKPGRLEALEACVVEMISEGSMDFKTALSIKGKMQFAEGQMFGRVAAAACRALSFWAKFGGRRKVDDVTISATRTGVAALKRAGPRHIGPRRSQPPALLFTDGACEEATSIGGVLIVPGAQVQYFGAIVSKKLADSWKAVAEQQQVIGQAELFPLWIARQTWAADLSGRRVISFVDNDAARLGMIRGYSPVLKSLEIISECLMWDHEFECDTWFARVPTEANVSDAPSRMEHLDPVIFPGALCVRPVFSSRFPPARILE